MLVLLPATELELTWAISRLNLALAPHVQGNLLTMVRAVEAYALDHLDTLSELDLNPIMVGKDGTVTAVDALIISGVVSGRGAP